MSSVIDNLKQQLQEIPEMLNSVICLKELSGQTQLEGKWIQLTNVCKILGDAARAETVRTPLGNARVIEDLATLLQRVPSEETDFHIQALRVLGNMCFDHEENRKHVKDSGVISTISPFFHSQKKELLPFVCGFYLNSSMDYDTGITDDNCITMCMKILDGIASNEEARKMVADTFAVKILVKRLIYELKCLEHLDMLDSLACSLLEIVMDDDILQNEIVDLGVLDELLDFLENTTIETGLAKEEKETLGEIKKAVMRLVVYSLSTDSKMDELFNDQHLLSRLMKMMTNPVAVVHQCAVYALGNLARSDDHCIELVEKYKLSKHLLDLFQRTENATFQYAILGCLKHLCLPITNKPLIGNENCIQIVSSTLDQSKDMLKRNQFLSIGIIKLLCTGNYKNSVKVIDGGVLSLIISFIKRVDDPAAKSEATRVITNVIKAIWVEEDSKDLRTKLLESDAIKPIVELICTTQFDVLKNDGIMALNLVFSDKHYLSFMAPLFPLLTTDDYDVNGQKMSFVTCMSNDICESKLPVQIKCNICVLLCQIIEVASLGKS
ncbi:ARM repeat-containing protein [Rhizopus microsporus var. microsporus]|uniref:ARM repeat-containing protein n=1 Tax=Rhizopus microsporus var. microsporus TaxID=86635 RepID=A0A1X0QQN2_RHIZD|nr:ARM repeat-containing protein [Rhizopus microsporus var. microsporus]